MPSARAAAAPPRRSVGASGGRVTSASRSVAMSLKARSSSAWSSSARAHGGALADRARDDGLEAAVAAQQVGGRLLADPLRAGEPVRRVAAQRDEVGHRARRDPVALLAPRAGPTSSGPSWRARWSSTVTCWLAHWNMSRSPVRISVWPPAAASAAASACSRSSASSVGVRHDLPAERLVQRGRALPLLGEAVRHRRAVRRDSAGRPRCGSPPSPARSSRRRRAARTVHAPQRLVDRAEQRVDRPPVAVRDGVRQREEPAVEQRAGAAAATAGGTGAGHDARAGDRLPRPCGRSPDSTSSGQAEGEDLGASDWHQVTQKDVDTFADVTGDHQWIHVDLERARETPFGGTITHGYLTLSLAPGAERPDLRARGLRLRAQLRPQQGPLPGAGAGRHARPRARRSSRRSTTSRAAPR